MKHMLALVLLLLVSASAVAGAPEDEAAATRLMTEYLNAFVSLDADRASTYFNEPFMFVTAANTSAFATRAEVAAWLKPGLSQLKERGYARSEWAPLRVKALGDGVVIASARAIRYKTDGTELETIGATYLVRRATDGWRIAVLTAHPASMALPLQ
jgi:ketosteroid isomerase-like protein